jgi:hypothetical protein
MSQRASQGEVRRENYTALVPVLAHGSCALWVERKSSLALLKSLVTYHQVLSRAFQKIK